MSEQALTFGSTYEENVYKALRALGWPAESIQMQNPIAGGRSRSGGQVIDFVLLMGGHIYKIIEVDGEHWHRDPNHEYLNDVEIMRWYRMSVPPVHLIGSDADTFEHARSAIQREIGRR